MGTSSASNSARAVVLSDSARPSSLSTPQNLKTPEITPRQKFLTTPTNPSGTGLSPGCCASPALQGKIFSPTRSRVAITSTRIVTTRHPWIRTAVAML